MAESIYKIIELSGTSKTSIEAAVQNAISRAQETIRNLSWFEVVETRGYIEKDHIAYWQVTLKLGFNVEEEQAAGKEKATDTEEVSKQKTPREEAPLKKEANTQASKYRCKVCGYIYDPEKGDPSQEIKPGTSFEELPDSWHCPECGVNKEQFEKIV